MPGVLEASAIKARARSLGFDLVGIARADRYPRLNRIRDWLASGRAGDMHYLTRSLGERVDPAAVLPSVRSIVCVASLYNTDQPYSTAVAAPGRATVARYAWGDDYHDRMRPGLRDLLRWMADRAGIGFEAFSCVDDGPVQERVFAEQAGLGWIGKNTCLINPTIGSWIVLGEVLVNVDLDPDVPGVDQCGACTRCLEACPTGALTEAYHLDATRCLSYLTIETRRPVDRDKRAWIAGHVAGCDICQDVCPWNRRAPVSDAPGWQPREWFASPRLVDLCRLTDEAWHEALRGSALRRAGLRRIRRSLAYGAAALDPAAREEALTALEAHPSAVDPDVADAIRWARGSENSRPLVIS